MEFTSISRGAGRPHASVLLKRKHIPTAPTAGRNSRAQRGRQCPPSSPGACLRAENTYRPVTPKVQGWVLHTRPPPAQRPHRQDSRRPLPVGSKSCARGSRPLPEGDAEKCLTTGRREVLRAGGERGFQNRVCSCVRSPSGHTLRLRPGPVTPSDPAGTEGPASHPGRPWGSRSFCHP